MPKLIYLGDKNKASSDVNFRDLSGFWPIKIAQLDKGHLAFFKVTEESFEPLLAQVDSILGFNLIPATHKAELDDQEGVLQIITEGKPAIFYYEKWKMIVSQEELTKAAVFDYIIDARDRSLWNLIINNSGKILLVANDRYMLFGENRRSSILVETAIKENKNNISNQILNSLSRAIEPIKALEAGSQDEREIIDRIIIRAGTLLSTEFIPAV